jgi:hypothetical protein
MRNTRRGTHTYRLYGLLIVLAGIAATSFIDTRPAGLRAHDWATAPDAALPTTYERLITLSSAYQRAAFSQLSPGAKSAVWQAHLRTIRSTDNLSIDEIEALTLAMDALTPAVFSGSRTEDVIRHMMVVCAAIRSAFGATLAGEVARLPSVESPFSESVRRWARAVQRVVGTAASASGSSDCDCIVDSWCTDCGDGNTCLEASECTVVPAACGCFFVWDCTEKCVTIEGL